MNTDEQRKQAIITLAEKVMGWIPYRVRSPLGKEDITFYGDSRLSVSPEGAFGWNPFENWADAGMLVEKLCEQGHEVKIDGCGGSHRTYECTIESLDPNEPDTYAHASTGPEAISLAALRTIK